jgi:hypothetical protein
MDYLKERCEDIRMKDLLGLFTLIFVLILLTVSQGCVSLPASPPGTRPVITHAYCIERGRYGDILKIYIEADDPNGNMFRIATVVDQVGYGHYPTSWLYLGPQYQHLLIGYLQWNTFSSNTSWMPEWTQITIQVSIFDTAGNESNTVVFPFEFVSEVVSQPLPPPPFDQENITRLGFVDINLFNPFQIGNDREHLFHRVPF